MKANRRFDAADLFCGAGGFTTGAVASGYVNVCLAINHWRPAIYTHEKNHPETRHICARIDELARAQGFPDGYYLHGTKAEQVKQIGNSVSPPVAEALCRTVAEEG